MLEKSHDGGLIGSGGSTLALNDSSKTADGLFVSILLGLPMFFLSAYVLFNDPLGLALLGVLLPFIVYYGGAVCLGITHRVRAAKGFAIGGTLASVLIVGAIIFLAFLGSLVYEA